ncbi:putative Phage head-tail adaptor, SPP1 family [uncultured Thiomicrorhabdus sp.]
MFTRILNGQSMKCCNYKAGDLRHSVTFQEMQTIEDGIGGRSKVWVDVKTLKCKVKPLNGKERLFADRIESNTTHKIICRYNPLINSKLRAVFKGRVMQIKSVINIDERNKWLEIHSVEGENT